MEETKIRAQLWVGQKRHLLVLVHSLDFSVQEEGEDERNRKKVKSHVAARNADENHGNRAKSKGH